MENERQRTPPGVNVSVRRVVAGRCLREWADPIIRWVRFGLEDGPTAYSRSASKDPNALNRH